jgi:DNA-binding MarR family transcriptional regulator
MSSPEQPKSWTFVTNHTQVLLCIAGDPHIRLRDVATRVGITERAAQRILADLVEAGYVDRVKEGRRNVYTIDRERMMRHTAQIGHEIGDLLDLLGDGSLADAGETADPAQPESSSSAA